MSEVVNQDAADAAGRPVTETATNPMVPEATSGGTLQAQGTDGVQGSTNVQGNVQGTSNVLQDLLDTPQVNGLGTPQADRQSAQGINPNLAVQTPTNGMQTFPMQGLPPATPMTQQSIAAPLLQPPIMGGISAQGSYVYAWTGGEPNPDWTGLKNPNTVNTNPLRIRSNSVKAA